MWPGVSDSFVEELENFLEVKVREKISSSDSEIRSVLVAMYQADTLISYCARRKKSAIVISADADYSLYIGPK